MYDFFALRKNHSKAYLLKINNDLEQIITSRTYELERSNLQLIQQAEILEQQAFTDPLTHAGNRRYFFKHASSKIEQARIHNDPISLIYLDLDNFKKINDTYGHLAGDCILKELSQRIIRYIGNDELFARFGGEEFVILSSGSNSNSIRMKALDILDLIGSSPFVYESTPLSVTSCIGVATIIPTNKMDINTLIRNADNALYKAKFAGKNRVEQY